MSRNMLHFNKLESFKTFLRLEGIEYRNGRGNDDYQIMQIQLPGTKMWAGIYKKLYAKEHYSVDKRLDWLIVKFILWEKQRG